MADTIAESVTLTLGITGTQQITNKLFLQLRLKQS